MLDKNEALSWIPSFHIRDEHCFMGLSSSAQEGEAGRSLETSQTRLIAEFQAN